MAVAVSNYELCDIRNSRLFFLTIEIDVPDVQEILISPVTSSVDLHRLILIQNLKKHAAAMARTFE